MVASDESNQVTSSITETSSSESIESAFPWKIHIVLDESERQGFEGIISWQGERAFGVHNPKKFEESIMKEYFNQNNYKSFQRQLHAHGFERSAIGDAIGGSYTHNLLIRGKPDMCRFMVRTKNKKKMRRRSSSSMLTSSCYIEKATRCSLMRQCSEPTGGPGRRQSIITTRSSNNYSLPSTSSSSTGPVSSSRFRSLGGSQNFRRTEENFANERFPKFPNFDNLPTSASSRNSSSRNLGPFKSPSSRTDEVMGWLPSPFGGTEMTSRLPSPPPSLNENNRSRHSSSKSMPAALTRFANSGPTSDEMFGGLDRDRDRVEESPIAGGQNCHLVRTLEASLSVLNMATQQQQPRVF